MGNYEDVWPARVGWDFESTKSDLSDSTYTKYFRHPRYIYLIMPSHHNNLSTRRVLCLKNRLSL